jgi:hypothetical protein
VDQELVEGKVSKHRCADRKNAPNNQTYHFRLEQRRIFKATKD